MISKEEVENIAKLARLELKKEEIEKMQKDLTGILGYFDLLKNVPEIKIPNPKSQIPNLRKDEFIEQKREVVEKIIAAAPDKKDDYIKVKTIL